VYWFGTDKEHEIRLLENPFYEQMAAEFFKYQISVNVYAFSDKYNDIASLGILFSFNFYVFHYAILFLNLLLLIRIWKISDWYIWWFFSCGSFYNDLMTWVYGLQLWFDYKMILLLMDLFDYELVCSCSKRIHKLCVDCSSYICRQSMYPRVPM